MNYAPRHKCCLLAVLATALNISVAYAAPLPSVHDHQHIGVFAKAVPWNVQAVRNGAWNNKRTWSNNAVPKTGDYVVIPTGRTVTVTDNNSSGIAYLNVAGVLQFDPNANTNLTVDTMLVAETGSVLLGTQASPIVAGRSAKITIKSDPSAPLDIEMKSRGLLVEGIFQSYAAQNRRSKARINGDARRGAKTITFADNLEGWSIGDRILVTGTYYRPPVQRGRQFDVPPLENEVRRITAINGRTVTLDTPLTYDHIRALPSVSIYVGNLTRPISITSAAASPVTERGHVMFMQSSKVNLNNTGFYQLGRSVKAQALSNTNVVGVYSLHFHRNGYENIQKVTNCVVENSPGWGIVNHSSYVDVRDNIVHDFAGSAYITEAGDELGSFIGNLASGGTNFPTASKVAHREVVTPDQRERFRQGDNAKFGVGFWLVGPRVTVENNVVANGRGTGFFYFGLGAIENGELTGFPLNRFPAGINPRTFKYNNQFTGAKMGLTSDLPIQSFRNNVAYGVFQGMRIRWSNDTAGFLLTKPGTRLSNEIAQSINDSRSKKPQRVTISDSIFWNIASGFAAGYSENFDIDNFTIANGKEYRIQCTKLCELHGFSLENGMGGNKTMINNSRVYNNNKPFVLSPKYQGRVTNSYVDGVLYRQGR